MVAITQTAAERVSEGVDGLYRTLCPVAPASKKRGRRKVKRRAPSVRVARGSVSAGVGVVRKGRAKPGPKTAAWRLRKIPVCMRLSHGVARWLRSAGGAAYVERHVRDKFRPVAMGVPVGSPLARVTRFDAWVSRSTREGLRSFGVSPGLVVEMIWSHWQATHDDDYSYEDGDWYKGLTSDTPPVRAIPESDSDTDSPTKK